MTQRVKSTILTGFLAVLMLAQMSVSLAAVIQVNALPRGAGCDLRDAIDSANTNSAVGGCTAGAVGQDTITFLPSFTNYDLNRIAFSDVSRGSSGTPEIVSEIRIVGPRDGFLTIRRPRSNDAFRLFIVASNGDLTLENMSLEGGIQVNNFPGGAIRVAGKLTLEQVEVVGSEATFGGAIWVQDGEAVIRNSLFRNNRASKQGGGIGLSANSRATIYDSTFSNNSAGEYGGGISLAAAPGSRLSIYNTTITENTADIAGGGISAFFAAPPSGTQGNSVTIRNTIISGNRADNDNKEVHIFNPFLANTNILNNVLGSNANTFGQSTNSTDFLRNDNIVATSNFEDTPLRSILEPLADNGGKTMTHALVANSPAIDSGLTFTLTGGPLIFFNEPGCRGRDINILFRPGSYRPDQRGVARPIGAVEFEPLEETCYVIKAKNTNVVTFCL